MKGNYTLREVYGSGGVRHKLIRLLEQPSIIREVINKIRPAHSKECMEAKKLIGQPPKMLIDVGAYIGEFSEAFLFNYPDAKIIAFEPNPENYNKLTKMPNVQAYSFGLWDKNTKKTYYLNKDKNADDQNSFLKPKKYNPEKMEIELKRFDSLNIAIEQPCFLKIDVEGAEYQVLQGFGDFLKAIDAVQVEIIHQDLFEGQSKVSEIVKLMEEQGFKGFKQMNLTYLSNKPHKSDLIFFKA